MLRHQRALLHELKQLSRRLTNFRGLGDRLGRRSGAGSGSSQWRHGNSLVFHLAANRDIAFADRNLRLRIRLELIVARGMPPRTWGRVTWNRGPPANKIAHQANTANPNSRFHRSPAISPSCSS